MCCRSKFDRNGLAQKHTRIPTQIQFTQIFQINLFTGQKLVEKRLKLVKKAQFSWSKIESAGVNNFVGKATTEKRGEKRSQIKSKEKGGGKNPVGKNPPLWPRVTSEKRKEMESEINEWIWMDGMDIVER
jgi:hypothetical protein